MKKEAIGTGLEDKVIVWDSDVDYADNELRDDEENEDDSE